MKDTKQPWFKEAKFGLFIHWGLYAIPEEYKTRKFYTIALDIEEETLKNQDLDW